MMAAAQHDPFPMPDDLHWVLFKLALVFALVLLNGFFVACEFAMVKVRSSQLNALTNGRSVRTKIAKHIVSHISAYLPATQLGVTLASLALGWLGEPAIATLIYPGLSKMGITDTATIHTVAFGIAFMCITFLHIVLGELVPKNIAIHKPVFMAIWLSAPLHWFRIIFQPVTWALNVSANALLKHVFHITAAGESDMVHSEEELRLIVAESAKGKEVTPVGKELLMNVLDLRQRITREIMTPRGEVVFLDIEDSFETNLQKARDSTHTRFPLCKGHLDNLVGIVHIKDLLGLVLKELPNPNLLSIKREYLLVPEMMPLEKLLTLFLSKHAHLGTVVDEFGGTVGIVTLDNVLEEVVGVIQDEFDTPDAEFKKISANEFTVNGALGLYELNDLAKLDLSSSEVSTVGGYITYKLGHLPKVGEQVAIDGYIATVTQTDGRRVGQIHFKRNA